jgi:hypothetical protein
MALTLGRRGKVTRLTMTTASTSVERPEPLPPGAKIRLAAEVISVYARVRWLLLRRVSLPLTLAGLRGGTERADNPPSVESIRIGLRLARIVNRTLGALPADSRCLVRSLVLVSLLARREISSTLVIGVEVEPSFSAHAWVEAGGRPLLPTGGGRYTRLHEL